MDVFGLALVLVFLSTLTDAHASTRNDELNNRPTIAILAQLVPTDIHNSYIAASYVKYLESAGARAVLIPTHFNQSEVIKLFSYVNGVLFPGGGAHWFVSPYYQHAKIFYDLAIQANKNGDFFPVWGTCLGFETLHVLTAGTANVLSRFAADDIAITLNFTSAATSSRLLKNIPTHLYKVLQTQNVTYNHHISGVSPEKYETSQELKSFFKVLSTNYDLQGKEFVSTVEAYNYPFYGAQWHPEKNNFEFNSNENIPHSSDAILVTQYMANFFVNEARKNKHAFPSSEVESNYLSYQYNAHYSGREEGRLENFEQIYLFRA